MKILLLGEYSAFHRTLKQGLLSNGISDVELYANQDSWKKIPDIDKPLFFVGKSGRFGIKSYLDAYRTVRDLKNYDVVQLIGPAVFPIPISILLLKKLKKQNRSLVLVSCGLDYANVRTHLQERFVPDPYTGDESCLKEYSKTNLKGCLRILVDKWLIKNCDSIIPMNHFYREGYIGNKNLNDPILQPINIDEVHYVENIVQDKIVFFHGIIREKEKGTPIIREALNKLKKKYPERVEVIVDGKIPYQEYLQILKRTNVVVDQCYGIAYGMNGAICMAQGKVLLSGNTKEFRNLLDIDYCPVINITPDVNQIFKECEKIVLNPSLISKLSRESRAFVEGVNDYKRIANKYLAAWNDAINRKL